MKDDLLGYFIIKDKKILNLLDKTLAFSFAICLLRNIAYTYFFRKFYFF